MSVSTRWSSAKGHEAGEFSPELPTPKRHLRVSLYSREEPRRTLENGLKFPSRRLQAPPLSSHSPMKTKAMNEAQFLALLQKVLPKATKDPHLASAIYEEVAKEVRLVKNLASFEKFCETGALPDMEPATVAELQSELAGNFGEANVAITPHEDGVGVAVEIALPDRTISSRVKVDPTIAQGEEVKPVFVPFPVSLPDDPELVWLLGRREDLGPDEASRALAKIEEEFWLTKSGQKLLRDRTERSFAEFIENVPSSALMESGLKRHYKGPEALRTLRLLTPGVAELALVPAGKEENIERPTSNAEGTESVSGPLAFDVRS